MPELRSLDLTVILIYIVGVTVLGSLMSRRTHNATEFIAAGRSLPGWVVGLSIVGTFVSSISFIANPGKSYSGNWNAFVFSLSLPAAAWFATRFFVDWYRDGEQLSAYERLEERFGPWARSYAALFNVLYHIGRVGTILFTVSLALSGLLPWPKEQVIPLIITVVGVLVIVYTLLGGIEAVIWTDVVQSIILIGGLVLCTIILVSRVPNGASGIVLVAGAAEGNKLSLGSLRVDSTMFGSQTFWMTVCFGFFINLQNFVADQTYVQRYFTTRTSSGARRSVWTGVLAYLPISALLFFIGTGLYVFFASHGGLPAGMGADDALPWFIATQLPAGVSGLLIAAVLAAAMSTVDSSLNSSATLLLCDIRRRYGRKRSDKDELRFLRLATIGLGVVGIGAALAMMSVRSALDTWWRISGILSGGTLGLILLARFTTLRTRWLSAVAVAFGVACIALVTFADYVVSLGPDLPAWLASCQGLVTILYRIRAMLHPQMAGLVGTAAILLVTVALSPLCRRRPG